MTFYGPSYTDKIGELTSLVEDVAITGFRQINLRLEEIVAPPIFNASAFHVAKPVRAVEQSTMQHPTEPIPAGLLRGATGPIVRYSLPSGHT